MSDDDIVASVAGDAPTDTAVVAAQTITPVQAVSTPPAQHVQPPMPAAPMPAALPAMASPVSAPLPAVPRKDEPPSTSAMPANPSQPGSKPGIGWKPMSDDD